MDVRLHRTVHVFDADRVTVGGVEFVRFELSAESFVYHQIRKMVGSLVAVAQGWLPPDMVKVALQAPFRMTMPLAPAGFLFLDYTPRAFWDYRTGQDRHVLTGAELAELIDFRETVIYPRIAAIAAGSEMQESLEAWLEKSHSLCQVDDVEVLREKHIRFVEFATAKRAGIDAAKAEKAKHVEKVKAQQQQALQAQRSEQI